MIANNGQNIFWSWGISGNSYVFNAEMKPMVLKPFVLIEFREREREREGFTKSRESH